MKKNMMIFAVMVLLVLIVLYMLSAKDIAPVPFDDRHAGITEEKKCLDCHAPGREAPLGKKHPPKFECFKCHELANK